MASILDSLPHEGAVFAGRTGAIPLPDGRFLLVEPGSARIVSSVSEPPDNRVPAPDGDLPVRRPSYMAAPFPSPVATEESEGEGSWRKRLDQIWPRRNDPDDYVRQDPYTGALIRVAQALRNAAPKTPVALSYRLTFGDPNVPEVAYQLKKAIQGIADATQMFQLPVVAGDLTTRADKDLHPQVEMSAHTANAATFSSSQAGCQTLKEGEVIALVGRMTNDLSGSLYAGTSATFPPPIDLIAEGRVLEVVQQIGQAAPLGRGGLLVTLARCCACARLGARVTLPATWHSLPPAAILFGEAQSRFLAFLPDDQVPELQQFAEPLQVPVETLGTIGGRELTVEGLITANLEELH